MKKLLFVSLFCAISTSILAQETTQMTIHRKDKTTQVINVADVDSITFKTISQEDEALQLSCEITELTSTHASYTITANQDRDTYYQFMMSETTFNNIINQYGTLQIHDQAWWTELSTYYENTDWQDIMRMFLQKGTKSFNSEEIIPSLAPNTTYVIYYYGLDNEGNMTSEIGETRFTTPEPQASENSFIISDVNVVPYGVNFYVTTTNNDTYFATVQSRSAVNSRLNSGMTMREVAQDFISTISNYSNIEDFLYNGSQGIHIDCSLENTDYVILVCGYDGGVSTDVVTEDFHTF